MTPDHVEGEFRGCRYTVRPASEQPGAPGPVCYSIEYGEGPTIAMMTRQHQTPAELGARVERILERVTRQTR